MNNIVPPGPATSRHTHATQAPHYREIRIHYPQQNLPIGPEKKTISPKKKTIGPEKKTIGPEKKNKNINVPSSKKGGEKKEKYEKYKYKTVLGRKRVIFIKKGSKSKKEYIKYKKGYILVK